MDTADMDRAELEARSERLIGQRLAGVRYYELAALEAADRQLPEPQWSRDPSFDSLDLGLTLTFDDASVCTATWASDFGCYGIALDWAELQDSRRVRCLDVATASRWQPLLGQRVHASTIRWAEPERGAPLLPLDCELEFERGAVVIVSAHEVMPQGDRCSGTDHITVFFDRATAATHRAGPER